MAASETQKKDEKPPEDYPFDQKLFQDPLEYTSAYLDYAEGGTRKAMEGDQKFHSFLVAIAELEEEEAIISELREKVPDLADKLSRFRNWLGKDSLEKERYEEVLSKAGRDLSFQYGVVRIKDVESKIEERLYLSAIGNEPGRESWVRDEGKHRVKIRDERLADLLCVLAIKRVQGALRKEDRTFKDRDKQKIQQLTDVLYGEGGIEPKYQQTAAKAEQKLSEYEKRRGMTTGYLEQTEISSETIGALVASLKRQAGEWQYSDFKTYKVLFNCLHMNKLGMIEIDSPVFRSLLGTLFPRIREEQWEICGKNR